MHAPCPDIVFGTGNALDSSTCACEPIWPPDACPVMKYTTGHHAVYNSTSGGCSCDLDYPSLICTAGHTSFYNSSTRACTCQKASAASVILRAPSIRSSTVNQLPPTAASTVVPPEATVSTAKLSTSETACRDLYWISEMTPQFESVTGQCKCLNSGIWNKWNVIQSCFRGEAGSMYYLGMKIEKFTFHRVRIF